MSITEPINIFLLAGGKSSRMGTNKAMLPFGGKTFTDQIISELKKVNCNLFISSNDSEMSRFNYPLVSDNFVNCGPIGALESALKRLGKDEWAFFTTCDMPFINHKLILPLYANKNKQDVAVYIKDNKPEPLFGFYNKRNYEAIYESIQNKEYSVTSLLNKLNVNYIPIDEPAAFGLVNINTPGEYSKHILGL